MMSCSDFSVEQQESILGTAGHYVDYLLLEAAMPWKHNILESRDVLALSPMLSQMSARLAFRTLLVAREEGVPAEMRYVAWLTLDSDKLEYGIREYHIPREHEERLIISIIEQTPACLPFLLGCDRRLVLVCVDGAHDACCGVKGYPLFRELAGGFEGDAVVQVKRCSHLGGHRYAPTCVDFPEGRYYGRIPEGKGKTILNKECSWEEILPYYRGNGCLSFMKQHIEAYALQSALPIGEAMNKYTVVEDGEVEIIASCGVTAKRVQKLYRVKEV